VAVILRTAALVTGSGLPSTGITQLWWLPQTTGGSTADATDCLARFREFWAEISDQMSDDISINFDATCICVEATTGVLTGAFTGTDPSTVTGASADDPLPRQTQGLLQLNTSSVISGRRVRGRLYIPGMVESRNDTSGNPSSGFISDVAGSAAAELLPAGATTSSLVVWHRPTNGAGGAHAAVTGVACSSSWAVLRSRRS